MIGQPQGIAILPGVKGVGRLGKELTSGVGLGAGRLRVGKLRWDDVGLAHRSGFGRVRCAVIIGRSVVAVGGNFIVPPREPDRRAQSDGRVVAEAIVAPPIAVMAPPVAVVIPVVMTPIAVRPIVMAGPIVPRPAFLAPLLTRFPIAQVPLPSGLILVAGQLDEPFEKLRNDRLEKLRLFVPPLKLRADEDPLKLRDVDGPLKLRENPPLLKLREPLPLKLCEPPPLKLCEPPPLKLCPPLKPPPPPAWPPPPPPPPRANTVPAFPITSDDATAAAATSHRIFDICHPSYLGFSAGRRPPANALSRRAQTAGCFPTFHYTRICGKGGQGKAENRKSFSADSDDCGSRAAGVKSVARPQRIRLPK